jgi:hypothetical protein
MPDINTSGTAHKASRRSAIIVLLFIFHLLFHRLPVSPTAIESFHVRDGDRALIQAQMRWLLRQ